MNDPLPPPSDEDLSAVLDGEAGLGLIARVEADPRARARLTALRDALASLRSDPVTPLDQKTVDHLIATAISPAQGEVSSLPPRVSRQTPPSWLIAAVVLACMAIGLGLVWSGRSNSGSATLTAATQKSSSSAALENDASLPSAPHDLPTTIPGALGGRQASGVIELGAFATSDALRVSLKERFPTESPAANAVAVTNLQVNRCQAQVQNILDITAAPAHVGHAVVARDPVLVYEFPASSVTGSTPVPLVAAVAVDTCAQVFTFQR